MIKKCVCAKNENYRINLNIYINYYNVYRDFFVYYILCLCYKKCTYFYTFGLIIDSIGQAY